MATQDINIRINLRDNASAKVDKFNTNLGGIGSSGSIAAAGITKMLGPLAAAIAAFQTMKRVITGVSDSIKLFADFDDTMRKVKAVTKATDAEFQAMVATAKQLGSTTRYTATQSAEALAFLGMAGFEASQAMEALPNVLNLAAAGGLDLGVAADIATNILSGFGLEVSQLARVNDVLAEAFTGSNTTLTELGEGFKYVGPIAKGVGADFEDLIASMGKLGDAGIKGCYDDKTDVLTLDGWKHWSDVSLEDKFATYNKKNNTIEYQRAIKLIRYHHKGKMYKVKNRGIDLCVTPDHRMFVKLRGKDDFEILRAEEIEGKAVRYLTGGMEWRGENAILCQVDGFLQNRGSWDKTIKSKYISPKIWAAFMGWYISEGSCNKYNGDYKITIAQNKPEHLDEIKSLLDKLPWHFTYVEGRGFDCCSEQLYRELKPLGKQLERYIPDYLKSLATPLLEILYDALIKGDGDQNGVYYTSSERLKDDVQEIALKLGYATFSKIIHEKGSQVWFSPENRYIQANANGWKVNVAERHVNPWWNNSDYTGVHGERLDYSRHDIFEGWIDYDGEVFCAEVPNHLLIVRRNGRAIVSGNSLAGTTLRGVIDALFNPTREEAVLMEDLSKRIGDVGLQIKNNKGNFVGFRSLVEQLEKAGLRGEEALKLFGARAGPGMAALLQVGSKALGDFEEELNNVDDTTSKIAATQEGGIGGAFRGLASAIEGAKLQLGEAFGEGLITTIQIIAESFRDVTKAIKELDESGIISKITKTLEVLAKTGSLAIDSIIAYAKEFYNLAAIGLNALTLNFDKVKERLDDVGKSFRSVLQERGVLGSDLEIQLGFINQQIDSTETQIEVLKKKIEQDRIDANGWRAKIAGAKQYEEQLARHNDELQELFQKVWDLNNTKLEIETNIKLEGLAQSIADEVRNANEEIGKIGTGTKDSDTNAEAQRLKALAEKLALEQRRLSEANARYLSDMKVIEAELESNYEQGVITLRQYYEGRRKLIEDAGNIEIAELQKRANEEIEGSEKASKADLKVYASKQKLTAELIKLDNQFITDSKKMEDELLKIQSENIEKKLAAEKVYNDLRVRIQTTGAGDLLEAEHQKELADLQARQRDELAIVEKGIEDELKLEEYKANQKREIDQLEYAHHKKVMMARLEIAQEIASGTSEAFADLYEMTGRKQKEWFYLAKAAALAEVAVSTATGIMKAYEQMGPYGAVGAALVAVQGAIQTSKILSTGLAAGGIVPGYSPNDKADNIPARLTAGEYVQPVDVVKHYGVGFMEALRQKTIPRDAFAYAGIRASNISKRSYADGGVVLPSPSDIQGVTGRERITIVNYTDRQELLSALSTKDGINAVVNVISANREKIARVLR